MKQTQERIAAFVHKHDLASEAAFRTLDLVSEVGEIAKEILLMTNYGKKKGEIKEELKGEIGDTLFSLMVLANELNIDLEEALEVVLAKYEHRLKKGSAGSEVE